MLVSVTVVDVPVRLVAETLLVRLV